MVFVAWKARLNLIAVTIVDLHPVVLLERRGHSPRSVGTFYSPWTRFWELTAGSALAAIVADQDTWLGDKFRSLYDGLRSRARVRDASHSPAWSLAMGAVFGLDRTRHYPGLWALLPVAGAFVMIAAGPEAWLNRTVLSQRVLVGIGLISYPLYLWHWPLLSFARLLASEPPPPAVRAALVAAAFVLAWLTYRLIEIPIRFGPRRRWVVPALCVAMAGCGAAGYYTFVNGGFVERPLNRSDTVNFVRFYDAMRRNGIAGPYRLECDFMEQGADTVKDSIPESCTAKGTGRTLFLWGDSYAYALAPGIRSVLPAGDALAQVTTSACRPGIGPIDVQVSGGRCKRTNDYALARIADLKPDIVILAQAENHHGHRLGGARGASARARRERGGRGRARPPVVATAGRDRDEPVLGPELRPRRLLVARGARGGRSTVAGPIRHRRRLRVRVVDRRVMRRRRVPRGDSGLDPARAHDVRHRTLHAKRVALCRASCARALPPSAVTVPRVPKVPRVPRVSRVPGCQGCLRCGCQGCRCQVPGARCSSTWHRHKSTVRSLGTRTHLDALYLMRAVLM